MKARASLRISSERQTRLLGIVGRASGSILTWTRRRRVTSAILAGVSCGRAGDTAAGRKAGCGYWSVCQHHPRPLLQALILLRIFHRDKRAFAILRGEGVGLFHGYQGIIRKCVGLAHRDNIRNSARVSVAIRRLKKRRRKLADHSIRTHQPALISAPGVGSGMWGIHGRAVVSSSFR
jgi:hypothetical protein